jgi:4-diphosphocytidyl-2-C-methyl-D-erythritol kinase
VTGSRFAPAKVNLFLHVGAVDPEGYHPVASLMVFADVGDRLAITPADRLALRLEGDFAAELADEDPERNLVVRAARLLLDRAGVGSIGLRLTLEKALPVAAGLGGGSSDAGAALKLIRDALELSVSDATLAEIAADLGADGPACLAARPVLASGRGDQLAPAPELPVLPAVMVNPRVACPTGRVYRAFDEDSGPSAGEDMPALAARYPTIDATITALSVLRNDLERPAITVAPVIGEVMAALRQQPETLLARLSGSGATAFALCGAGSSAQALAERMAAERPQWWVRPCRLGGPWPTPDQNRLTQP